MTKQPEALRLADKLIAQFPITKEAMYYLDGEAAAELRRLHSLNLELLEALITARENVADWGTYASEYSQEKWDLAGDLASIDAAIAKAEQK